MKKLLCAIIFSMPAASLSAAACPSGYTATTSGAYVFAENGAACPAGYETVSLSSVLPNPSTGSDSKGSFTYGQCSY